jgi:hypothetical protein
MLAFLDPEPRIPEPHPLRTLKQLTAEALQTLSPVFDAMPRLLGRHSIPGALDKRHDYGGVCGGLAGAADRIA